MQSKQVLDIDARLAQLDRALASGATPYAKVAVNTSTRVAQSARKSTDLHDEVPTERPYSDEGRYVSKPLCLYCGEQPVKERRYRYCGHSCWRKVQALRQGLKLGTRFKPNGKKAKYKCCICGELIVKRPYCRAHRYSLKQRGLI